MALLLWSVDVDQRTVQWFVCDACSQGAGKKEAPHALINVWCSGYYFDENNPKLKAGRVICVSPLSEAEILAAPETTK